MIVTHVEDQNRSVNDLKARNLRNIMCSLLVDGPQTKMDLLLATKLSSSTVSDLINDLLSGGIVSTCGSERSSGGRRPVIYRIRHEASRIVGIAIDESRLDVTVTDLVGTPLRAWRAAFSERTAFDALFATIEEVQGMGSSPLAAIGVGIHGRVEPKSGIVLEEKSCGWRNVPLKELLERRFGVLVTVDHRVNARATAEAFVGAAKGLGDFVCIYQDAPEKAAIAVDGVLLHGSRGRAGIMHGKPERLLRCLDTGALVTDRRDILFQPAIPAVRTGPDFSPDCAMMAEISWFDLLYDNLREAVK